jgi:hypothetical protein
MNIPRNQACFCGSGRKYKNCHGARQATESEHYAIIKSFLLASGQLVHVAPPRAPGSLHGRRLVIVHIPKTAGTTLDRILDALALRSGVGRLRALGTVYGQFMGEGKGEAVEHLRRADPEVLATAEIFSGHVPALLWEPTIDGRRVAYATLLRDPTDRMISHYAFGVSRGGWGRETAIESLVRSGHLVDNVQVRMLAGCDDARQPCDDAMLKTALANLQSRFALIGTTDRFDAFLATLLALYGWPDIIYARYHVGATRIDEPRHTALRAEASAFNTFDAELLARVREHGDVWINCVDAEEPPPRSQDVLMPLWNEGELACISRGDLAGLERLAKEVNCQLTHA